MNVYRTFIMKSLHLNAIKNNLNLDVKIRISKLERDKQTITSTTTLLFDIATTVPTTAASTTAASTAAAAY